MLLAHTNKGEYDGNIIINEKVILWFRDLKDREALMFRLFENILLLERKKLRVIVILKDVVSHYSTIQHIIKTRVREYVIKI